MTESAPTFFTQQRLSRRRFIQFGAMGAGAVAVSPYLSRLEAFAAPPVANDQGILVTIQLSGGNDGLNMLVPAADATYAALRPTLKVTNGLSIGSGFALHPSLAKTKARYDQGNVAIVRGVGYQPPDLSHFSSTDIWMHGWGGSGTPTTGWVGRFLDGLPNTTQESLYGVSLHGSVNPHLNGAVAHPSSLPLSIGDAFGIDRSDASYARMFDAVASYGDAASGLGPLGDAYDTTAMELMQLTQRIRPAYTFPAQDTDIGQQLVLAAHLVNANLGIRVIDTSMGGFDTHSGQAAFHAQLLAKLDAAIDAFFATLAPRWRGQVAVMTFSEFGRRPDENGDGGTDHGAASPLLVIGDHVRGGLHGTQPSLTDLDEDGDLKPSVDFRAVYASVLGTWLRADDRAVLGATYSPLSLFSSPPSAPPAGTPATSQAGYWLVGPGGAVHGFGAATKFGSLPRVDKPIVAGASTPTHRGLWLSGTDGGIFSFGDAKFYGSMGGKRLDRPIVGMTSTPSGRGYWLCASDGGMFCFGDAKFYGSMGGKRLDRPIVAMAATASGRGYWLCASDGGIFSFGDARFHGSKMRTAAPVCGFARTTTGNGYWMTARDGTVAAFGDAPVLGRVSADTAVLVRA